MEQQRSPTVYQYLDKHTHRDSNVIYSSSTDRPVQGENYKARHSNNSQHSPEHMPQPATRHAKRTHLNEKKIGAFDRIRGFNGRATKKVHLMEITRQQRGEQLGEKHR